MVTNEHKAELLMKRTTGHIQHVEELLAEIKKNKDKIAALQLKTAVEV